MLPDLRSSGEVSRFKARLENQGGILHIRGRVERIQPVVILADLFVDVSPVLLPDQRRHVQPAVPLLHRLVYAVCAVINELVLVLVEKDRFGRRRHSCRHIVDFFLHVRGLPRKLRAIEHEGLVDTGKR